MSDNELRLVDRVILDYMSDMATQLYTLTGEVSWLAVEKRLTALLSAPDEPQCTWPACVCTPSRCRKVPQQPVEQEHREFTVNQLLHEFSKFTGLVAKYGGVEPIEGYHALPQLLYRDVRQRFEAMHPFAPVEQEPDTGGQIEQITAERDAFRACLKGFSDSLPSDEHMRAQGKEPGPLLVQMRKLLEGYAPDRSGSVMDFAVSILHGDDEHQAWLLEEAAKWMPVPTPTEQPHSYTVIPGPTLPESPSLSDIEQAGGHLYPNSLPDEVMAQAPKPEQPSGEDGEIELTFNGPGEVNAYYVAVANPQVRELIGILRDQKANLLDQAEERARRFNKALKRAEKAERQLEALQAKYSELEGLVGKYVSAYESWAARGYSADYESSQRAYKALFAHHTEARGDG